MAKTRIDFTNDCVYLVLEDKRHRFEYTNLLIGMFIKYNIKPTHGTWLMILNKINGV